MKKTLAIISLIFLIACNNQPKHPQIIIKTTVGDITIELYPKQAPITVSNFLKLIDDNAFEGATFYRTVTLNNQPDNEVKIEVIQGGLAFTKDLANFETIAHESTATTRILHENGVISMARNKPGSASTEFFICVGDQPSLDFDGNRNPDLQGFSAFGKVVKGLEIVKQIQEQSEEKQLMKPRIPIKSIKRINI